jgi:hypothetical protein
VPRYLTHYRPAIPTRCDFSFTLSRQRNIPERQEKGKTTGEMRLKSGRKQGKRWKSVVA